MTYSRRLACNPSRCQETFVLESDTQREEKSLPRHSVLCQHTIVGSHDGLVLFIEDFGVLHKPISMFDEFHGLQAGKLVHGYRVGGQELP